MAALKLLLAAAPAAVLASCAVAPQLAPSPTAPALVETAAVKTLEDAADDPAIWRNADTPSESLILGTDKKSGLYLYGMTGETLQYLAAGNLNNIDLRGGWSKDGAPLSLAAASDRTNDAVALFWLDGPGKTLAPAGLIATDLVDPYGMCMYQNAAAETFAIVIGKDGQVRQFSLSVDEESWSVSAEEVRRFAVGAQSEGCVADDRTGKLYIGEEEKAIWVYGAEALAGDAREMFAPVDGTTLVADVEGLALAPEGETAGILAASSQGDSAFVLYDLETKELIGRVRIADAGAVDGVTGTDGIDLALGDFGPGFENGVFVAQDDENAGAPGDGRLGQNFKYVSWAEMVAAARAGLPE